MEVLNEDLKYSNHSGNFSYQPEYNIWWPSTLKSITHLVTVKGTALNQKVQTIAHTLAWKAYLEMVFMFLIQYILG